MENEMLLTIRDLFISFATSNGKVNAIRGMRLDVMKGQTVAIVGESGSGKSVTVKAVMGIMSNNEHIDGGTILYSYTGDDGQNITVDIAKLSEKEVRQTICGKHIAMVFQDPMTALNPTVTIGKQSVFEIILTNYLAVCGSVLLLQLL
jgi:oligopeptide transport system ATP-binding protein